ncbi:unnamed protein product [marine sediment metagenome]|uniref:Uncharacterized protein n=1 Tax=marine sediment metagenome TaxID=412755 RepID=X1SAW6_9ZZZZ
MISTGDEMSIFDSPQERYSRRSVKAIALIFTLGLWLRAIKLSPETYTLVSDGALSHLMRK